MIKELKMFTVICDICGKDVCDEEEYAGFSDVDYVKDIAYNYDWIENEDEDICNECYEYDDNDNLIIYERNN